MENSCEMTEKEIITMKVNKIKRNPFYVFVEFWENGTWNLSVINIFQFLYGVIFNVISLDSTDRFAEFRWVKRSRIL